MGEKQERQNGEKWENWLVHSHLFAFILLFRFAIFFAFILHFFCFPFLTFLFPPFFLFYFAFVFLDFADFFCICLVFFSSLLILRISYGLVNNI